MKLYAMVSGLFLNIAVVLPLAAQVTTPNYYVAPPESGGSDANPGTIDQPFATIAHARNVVRPLARNMSSNINVFLRGGTYIQNQTLTFNAEDSGTNNYNVIYQAYPGETPLDLLQKSVKQIRFWAKKAHSCTNQL